MPNSTFDLVKAVAAKKEKQKKPMATPRFSLTVKDDLYERLTKLSLIHKVKRTDIIGFALDSLEQKT